MTSASVSHPLSEKSVSSRKGETWGKEKEEKGIKVPISQEIIADVSMNLLLMMMNCIGNFVCVECVLCLYCV